MLALPSKNRTKEQTFLQYSKVFRSNFRVKTTVRLDDDKIEYIPPEVYILSYHPVACKTDVSYRASILPLLIPLLGDHTTTTHGDRDSSNHGQGLWAPGSLENSPQSPPTILPALIWPFLSLTASVNFTLISV